MKPHWWNYKRKSNPRTRTDEPLGVEVEVTRLTRTAAAKFIDQCLGNHRDVSSDSRPFGRPWGKDDQFSFVLCDCGGHWSLFVKGCGYVGTITNRQFELLTSNDAATREIFPAAQKEGWEGVRRILERLEAA